MWLCWASRRERQVDFCGQRRRGARPARNSVLRAGMGLRRAARVRVPVRAAPGARGRDGSGADYGCERMGTAAGCGVDGSICASRRNRGAVLRARRAPVGLARVARRVGGTGAMGRRDSSACRVFVSDNSDFARRADAETAGGMDSARRASALERIATCGIQVAVGEGLHCGCVAAMWSSI